MHGSAEERPHLSSNRSPLTFSSFTYTHFALCSLLSAIYSLPFVFHRFRHPFFFVPPFFNSFCFPSFQNLSLGPALISHFPLLLDFLLSILCLASFSVSSSRSERELICSFLFSRFETNRNRISVKSSGEAFVLQRTNP